VAGVLWAAGTDLDFPSAVDRDMGRRPRRLCDHQINVPPFWGRSFFWLLCVLAGAVPVLDVAGGWLYGRVIPAGAQP